MTRTGRRPACLAGRAMYNLLGDDCLRCQCNVTFTVESESAPGNPGEVEVKRQLYRNLTRNQTCLVRNPKPLCRITKAYFRLMNPSVRTFFRRSEYTRAQCCSALIAAAASGPACSGRSPNRCCQLPSAPPPLRHSLTSKRRGQVNNVANLLHCPEFPVAARDA